jgi:hypothetical protein
MDVVLVPSCDAHLHQVRAYLSEFAGCRSMDPELAPEAAAEIRDQIGQRLMLLEPNTFAG